jgi:hypothetical protein
MPRARLIFFVVALGAGVGAASAWATTGTQTYTAAGEHVFTVPAGVSAVQVTLIGGNGGSGRFPGSAGGAGGQGATVTAAVAVTPGETLYAEVAGNGESGSAEGSGGGGTGGGATGGEIFFVKGGGGGGGASDLRTCGVKCAGPSLPTRLLVAGGGGGGGGEGGLTAVSGGPGGSADRSGTAGSVLPPSLQAGQGGQRATASGGGSGGAVSFECPKLASCSQAGVEGAGGKGGAGTGGGGGGGGGGGIFGGGGGGGGEGFEFAPLNFENAGGGGGGGGSSGVPAAGAGRVSGFLQLLTTLGAEPSISISWTIPAPPTVGTTSPSGSSSSAGSSSSSGTTANVPPSSATPAPRVNGLALSPPRFRRGRHPATIARTRVPSGTTIAFALTQSATVTLSFEQPHTGVRAGTRCVSAAAGPAGHHGRPCTRWVALAHRVSRQAHAGTNRVHFEGVLDGGSRLAPGRYRLSLSAVDAGGGVNAPQHPGFTLLP